MYSMLEFAVALCLMLGAVLYTSVGHAGASAYIAIMSLFGIPANVVKPTALALNILVSSYTSWRYIANKLFDFHLFVMISTAAIPAAFIGGYINLPAHIYKPIVGVILLISGIKFIFQSKQVEHEPKRPHLLLAMLIGGIIGLLSGLTGTGGGIFLSPLILFLGWTTVKGASGTASAFIFVNSVSGLLGNISSVSSIPATLPLYAVSVLIGAFIGTKFGIQYFSSIGVKRALGAVLLIAGGKLALNL